MESVCTENGVKPNKSGTPLLAFAVKEEIEMIIDKIISKTITISTIAEPIFLNTVFNLSPSFYISPRSRGTCSLEKV
jgi:hypothetical protein